MTKSGFDLADLKRIAVKRQLRVKFALPNGMDCVVHENGIAKVAALQQVPGFNLEDCLKSANAFEVTGVAPGERWKRMDRAEMEALISTALGQATAAAAADHED